MLSKILKFRREVLARLREYKVPVDMLLSVIILSLILLGLGANLFSKIQESRKNYEVFVSEQAALDQLVAENIDLRKKLEYYSSLEYKLLYARDSLNRVRKDEKLYELSQSVILYNYEPEPVYIYDDLEPLEIWKHLLWEGIM